MVIDNRVINKRGTQTGYIEISNKFATLHAPEIPSGLSKSSEQISC